MIEQPACQKAVRSRHPGDPTAGTTGDRGLRAGRGGRTGRIRGQVWVRFLRPSSETYGLASKARRNDAVAALAAGANPLRR